MNPYSIAIDGPAGAGKSTIAKMVSKQLGFVYVDTGAMYRAIGLYCLENNIACDDEEKIDYAISQIDIIIEYEDNEQQVILNNQNVTSKIRTNEVSKMASAISVHSKVRIKLVELQRKLASKTNVVMDGRDIGTYVLPNATTKIFLTASEDIRAQRRCNELLQKGIEANFEHIKKEIKERDLRDMNRTFAPLVKADDAIEVDTSNMSIIAVTERIIQIFKSKDL